MWDTTVRLSDSHTRALCYKNYWTYCQTADGSCCWMMLKKNNFLHYQRRYNKKLSCCWKACATPGPSITRMEESRQLVGRRTAVSYAEGVNVSADRRVVQHCHCSAFLSDRKLRKSTGVTLRLSFPLEFRNNNAVLESHTGRSYKAEKKVWWYL